MSHSAGLLRLAILAVGIFCLALQGCATKTEQSATNEQKAAPEPGPGESPAGSAAPNPAPAPAEPTPPPPRRTTLEAGTAITVFTTSTLSTKTNKSGEPFEATLAGAISDGDWVIAPKGATVSGVIAESDPGGRVKGTASITLRLKKVTLASGEALPIASNTYTAVAKSTKKKDAAKVGIGAGLGAAIGAIAGGGKGAAIGAGVGGAAGTGAVLATHGDPATIPAETKLTFKLTSPVEVTERR